MPQCSQWSRASQRWKKLTHCSLFGEEEGPVKWHQLGASCMAGPEAKGRGRSADVPCSQGASGHIALPGLWQQLPVEWGWQGLWREACVGLLPELESCGQLPWNCRQDRNRGRPKSPKVSACPPLLEAVLPPGLLSLYLSTLRVCWAVLSLLCLLLDRCGPHWGRCSAMSHMVEQSGAACLSPRVLWSQQWCK